MKFSRWFTVNIVVAGLFLICGIGVATSAESPHWLSSTLVRVQSDSDPYFDPFDLSTVPAPVAKIPSTGLKTELEPETAAILPMPSIPQPLVKTESISTESVSRGAFPFAVGIQPLGPKPLAIPRPAESSVLVSGIRTQPVTASPVILSTPQMAASPVIFSTQPVTAAPLVFTAQPVTAALMVASAQSKPLVKTAESVSTESVSRGAFVFDVSIQPLGPKPLAMPDPVKSQVLASGIRTQPVAAAPVIFSTQPVTAAPVIFSAQPVMASPVILSTQPVAAGPLVPSIQPMTAGPMITSTQPVTTPTYVSSMESAGAVSPTSSGREPYRPAVRSPYSPSRRPTL
ncbi:MAG: hypothetical protein WCJ35_19035 [Planctomycetota bacterium]